MKQNKINQELVQKLNRDRILALLRSRGALSRSDITRALPLSPPTVSTHIKLLLEEGTILNCGRGKSGEDRTVELYDLNYRCGYILAADLSTEQTVLMLGDLRPSPLARRQFRISSSVKGHDRIKAICTEIMDFLTANSVSSSELLNISLCTPGIFDPENEVLRSSPKFNIGEEFPVKTAFQSCFNLPVLITKDVAAAAFIESARYGHRGAIAFLKIDLGPGAGIMLNGELFTGLHGAAGEIGDLLVADPEGHYRRAGDILSVSAIERELELRGICPSAGGSLKQLLALLRTGNGAAAEYMEYLSETIAAVIINLASCYDLDTLIIGGRISCLQEELLDRLVGLIQKHRNGVPVLGISEYGDEAAILGALHLGCRANTVLPAGW